MTTMQPKPTTASAGISVESGEYWPAVGPGGPDPAAGQPPDRADGR